MKKQFSILMALMLVTFGVLFTSCEKEDLNTRELIEIEGKKPEGALKSTSTYTFPELFDGSVPSHVSYLYSITLSYDANNSASNDGTGSAKFVKAGSGWIVLNYGVQDESDDIEFSFQMKSNDAYQIRLYLSHTGTSSAIDLGYFSFSQDNTWTDFTTQVAGDIQYAVDNYSGWDWNDNYQLTFAPMGYRTYWVDEMKIFGGQSPSCTVSGPSSAYVSYSALNSYTATFTAGCSGYYAYEWTIHSGGGTIVGSSTSSSVTIDFDTYGGKQISLRVKEEAGQDWSSTTLKSHTIFPQY